MIEVKSYPAAPNVARLGILILEEPHPDKRTVSSSSISERSRSNKKSYIHCFQSFYFSIEGKL